MYLVDAIRKDREMGARLLIEEFGVRLFATAYRLCLNDADAEDLTSRTFARAVERIADFDGKSSLFTWLCAIMMNFRRMDMRRKGANVLDFTDAVPEREDPHPDPGEALSCTEEADAIRKAVESLPESLREPTVLHYFDGFDAPEIARMTSVPEGTVYYRLHQARAMLRKKLSPRFYDDGASKRMEQQVQ